MRSSEHKSLRPWLVLAVAVGGTVLLAAYALADPSSPAYPFPRCLFHSLTGLDCPGCGSQRALHALLGGHPLEALRFNPLMVALLPLTALLLLAEGLPGRLPRLQRLSRSTALHRAAAFAVIAFFIVRNLPFYNL